MKIKKNDTILVISGKDRGKKGRVVQVFPGNNKIIVEGVNIQKKHRRPKRGGEKGQIMEISVPIDASNVKIFCSKCGKATRVGRGTEGEEKVRICKKCRQIL